MVFQKSLPLDSSDKSNPSIHVEYAIMADGSTQPCGSIRHIIIFLSTGEFKIIFRSARQTCQICAHGAGLTPSLYQLFAVLHQVVLSLNHDLVILVGIFLQKIRIVIKSTKIIQIKTVLSGRDKNYS
jgi:hypothetical protein